MIQMTITAHGATYATVSEARARIAELEALNALPGVGPSDGRVTEILIIMSAIAEHEAARKLELAHQREFPFYVLTRRYLASGSCIKGRKEFRTRAEQARYILRAPDSIAITAYN
jgi:hypothetical protein